MTFFNVYLFSKRYVNWCLQAQSDYIEAKDKNDYATMSRLQVFLPLLFMLNRLLLNMCLPLQLDMHRFVKIEPLVTKHHKVFGHINNFPPWPLHKNHNFMLYCKCLDLCIWNRLRNVLREPSILPKGYNSELQYRQPILFTLTGN